MKSKEVILLLIALFSTAVLAAGCGNKDKAAVVPQVEKPQKIHIGYQTSSTVILLAKAKGIYEEEFAKDGIEVKYDLYLAGPPMIEAFAGGRADFASTGDMPPVSARAAGVDIKIISRAGYTPKGNALLVRPDAAYQSVDDLKGKKIAVQIGSSAHHYLILLLKQHGLSTGDVNIVNLAATEHQAVLGTGNVDAVATWEPWASVLENAKAGKVWADSSSGVKRYLQVFLARNDFAEKYPDIATRFLKASEKAQQFIKENPDEALALIAEENKLPAPVLARIVKETDWDGKIIADDVAAFQQVKNFLQETKVFKKDYDINELFDDRYFKQLHR